MDVEQLISAVYNKPPIWDKRDKLYRNRHHVDQCWKEISTLMGQDETKLKLKWKYLRDKFCVESSRMLGPDSEDTSEPYVSKWHYFNSLLFLKKIITPRQPLVVPPTYTRNESETVLTGEEVEHEVQSPSPVEPVDFSVDEEDYDVSETLSQEYSESSAGDQRRQDIVFDDAIFEMEERKMQYVMEKYGREQTKEEADEENLEFFRSLLPHVRKVPPLRLLDFRNRILEVVRQFAYQPNLGHSVESQTPTDELRD